MTSRDELLFHILDTDAINDFVDVNQKQITDEGTHTQGEQQVDAS